MKSVFACLLFFVVFIQPACASDNIKQLIGAAAAFSPSYGANALDLGKTKALVIRGAHNTETASSGDVFLVLIQDKDLWQSVYRDGVKNASPLFITAPHTYDDSIVSYRFFTVKDGAKQKASLYVLEAARDMDEALTGKDASYVKPSHVVFTLYQLMFDDGFEIYSFKPIKTEHTQKSYCNADWALFMELAIPVPHDEHEYDCNKLK